MKWYTNFFTLIIILVVTFVAAFVVELIWHMNYRNPFAILFVIELAYIFGLRIYLMFKKKKNRV